MQVIRVKTVEKAIESVELGLTSWGVEGVYLSDYERGKLDGVDIVTVAIENAIAAYAKEI